MLKTSTLTLSKLRYAGEILNSQGQANVLSVSFSQSDQMQAYYVPLFLLTYSCSGLCSIDKPSETLECGGVFHRGLKTGSLRDQETKTHYHDPYPPIDVDTDCEEQHLEVKENKLGRRRNPLSM